MYIFKKYADIVCWWERRRK